MCIRDRVGTLELELVAGERAAGAPIRWVHVSELEDPAPWLSGGELLLSTGMQLHDEESQRAYIGRLVEHHLAGLGFGLGFSIVIDSAKSKSLTSEGTFAWGGMASTEFWVDPAEDLTVGFYTQLLPSRTYPIRREMRQFVYQALVD